MIYQRSFVGHLVYDLAAATLTLVFIQTLHSVYGDSDAHIYTYTYKGFGRNLFAKMSND